MVLAAAAPPPTVVGHRAATNGGRPPRRHHLRPAFSIGEEDERGESIFVGKGKREKDKRKMRDFSLTAFIYAAHDPNPV